MPAEYRPTSAAPAGARRASSSLKCESTHWRSAGRVFSSPVWPPTIGKISLRRSRPFSNTSARARSVSAASCGRAHRGEQLRTDRRILAGAEVLLGGVERVLAAFLHRHFQRDRAQILRHRVGVQLRHRRPGRGPRGPACPSSRDLRVLQRVGEEVHERRRAAGDRRPLSPSFGDRPRAVRRGR